MNWRKFGITLGVIALACLVLVLPASAQEDSDTIYLPLVSGTDASDSAEAQVEGATAEGTEAVSSPNKQAVQINDRAAHRRVTAEMLMLPDELQADVQTRAALGLNADPEYVASLRESMQDGAAQDGAAQDGEDEVEAAQAGGTNRYGFPLTAEEAAEVAERFAFASATREDVLPYAESLPTFAGAFYDHQADGELVILLTEASDEVLAEISTLAPAPSSESSTDDGSVEAAAAAPYRATRVEVVQHTQEQLRAALPQVWEEWKAIGGPELYGVAVDTPANAVRIDVDPTQLEVARAFAPRLGETLAVPVFFDVGERPEDDACSSRTNCTNPMRAGTVIRQGSTGGGGCTMGFHTQVGSDERFVTAGHCGYSGSNNWFHAGYTGNGGCGTGCIGSELITQYYNNGRDIMVVQMPDDQDSSYLYAIGTPVTQTRDPSVGQGICAARGFSSVGWKCGVVENAYTSWTSPTCNCIIYGGDSNLARVTGDSGSPIVDADELHVAIGIHNTSTGGFAIFNDTGYQLRSP